MPKVLIAEDELMIADMIAEVLAENGYDLCGIARSVAEAIELGEARRPGLAVIDLHLADGSLGAAIAHRLRRQGSLGVLYMTGGANDITLTANDGEVCLRKPFALRNLGPRHRLHCGRDHQGERQAVRRAGDRQPAAA